MYYNTCIHIFVNYYFVWFVVIITKRQWLIIKGSRLWIVPMVGGNNLRESYQFGHFDIHSEIITNYDEISLDIVKNKYFNILPTG